MVFRLLILVLKLQLTIIGLLSLTIGALLAQILPESFMHRISTAAFRSLDPEAQLAYTVIMDAGLPAIEGITRAVDEQNIRNHTSELEYLSIIKSIAETDPETGARLLTELQANGIKGVNSILSTVFEGYDRLLDRVIQLNLAQDSTEKLERYLGENYEPEEDLGF